MTISHPLGPIGRIEVSNPPLGVAYTLSSPSTELEVVSNSGQLNFLVEVELSHNNSRFIINATLGSEVATTELQVLVLHLNHGDHLALGAVKAVRGNMMHTTPAATIFVPAILDVILQQVSAGYPLSNTSKAEEIVTKAIAVVKATITQTYGK